MTTNLKFFGFTGPLSNLFELLVFQLKKDLDLKISSRHQKLRGAGYDNVQLRILYIEQYARKFALNQVLIAHNGTQNAKSSSKFNCVSFFSCELFCFLDMIRSLLLCSIDDFKALYAHFILHKSYVAPSCNTALALLAVKQLLPDWAGFRNDALLLIKVS